MRVCFLISKIHLSAEGGALVGGGSNSLIRLLKGLGDHCQASIFTSPPYGRKTLDLTGLGLPNVSVVPTPVKSPVTSIAFGLEFWAKATWAMVERRSQMKFDIVHGHSGYPHYVLASLTAGRIWGAPVVQTLGCPLKVTAKSGGASLNLALFRYLMLKLDKIIAISRNVATSLTDIGIPEDRIRVIPPSIDLERFSRACSGDAERRKLGADGPLILFVGNLSRTKGLDVLLRAMQPVSRRFPTAILAATLDLEVKHSPREQKMKEEILGQIERYGLAKRVTLLGVVENMPELMAAADVLVAPFLSTDGPSDYPLALLEAMAVGTPVVATPVGGIPEVVQDGKTGILVPPGDAEALAGAIASLLDSPKTQEGLETNASDFVSSRFSIEKVARQVESVYEEVRQHRSKK